MENGVSTSDTWFKRVGFPYNWSYNYYDKDLGGDTNWNSKGASWTSENKIDIKLVVLDFFFELKGFFIGLLFPSDKLDVWSELWPQTSINIWAPKCKKQSQFW